MDGRRIKTDGSGPGSRGTFAGLKVGAMVQVAVGLGVKSVELMILSCWLTSTTLRLAKLVSGKINLPVNFFFSSLHS